MKLTDKPYKKMNNIVRNYKLVYNTKIYNEYARSLSFWYTNNGTKQG